MADFCRQCSIKMFGADYGDLAGLMSIEEAAQGMLVTVLCEGCGAIQVDNDGVCRSEDCLEKGHKHAR